MAIRLGEQVSRVPSDNRILHLYGQGPKLLFQGFAKAQPGQELQVNNNGPIHLPKL